MAGGTPAQIGGFLVACFEADARYPGFAEHPRTGRGGGAAAG
jgi:hypothetical protein